MSLLRFVPIRPVCALRRHPQKRYSAWKDGIQVVVYTCRCGRRQDTKVIPANRKLRRAAAKVRR